MATIMNETPADHLEATSGSPNTRVTTAAVTALLLGLVAIVLMLMLAYFVFAQRIPELTPKALEAAQVKWTEVGPAHYVMDIEIGGARPGPVHVEVVDGEVVAMTRDGKAPAQERVWAVWSVPGMFETIERELELAENPEREMNATEGTKLWLRCEFDPQFGYPKVFHRAVRGGGPEVYWKVTKFETK
jgi:hypothetical protein